MFRHLAAVLATVVMLSVTIPSAALAQTATNNPYRTAYENAIRYGAMVRPSLVADHKEALQLAAQALRRGDRHEAGKRAAQAVVIYSEQVSPNSVVYVADSFAQTLGLNSLRELPTFNVVMPFNLSGKGGNRMDEFGYYGLDENTASRPDISQPFANDPVTITCRNFVGGSGKACSSNINYGHPYLPYYFYTVYYQDAADGEYLDIYLNNSLGQQARVVRIPGSRAAILMDFLLTENYRQQQTALQTLGEEFITKQAQQKYPD